MNVLLGSLSALAGELALPAGLLACGGSRCRPKKEGA